MNEQTFQTKNQLLALKAHAVLVKVASFLYTPVRMFLESFDGTTPFREKARALKVVK
jgi:hypothetical protein